MKGYLYGGHFLIQSNLIILNPSIEINERFVFWFFLSKADMMKVNLKFTEIVILLLIFRSPVAF